ncbi:MAG: YdeI/OmpD-associated family protein [Terracidiphilus sp.]
MPKTPSNPLKFKAQLIGRGPGGAWTYLPIPFSVPEVFGRKGQVPVRATINGFTFRNSLMPRAGVHILGVGKDILAAASASTGDTVEVELAFDDAPRTVAVPADLQAALARHPAQAKAFDEFSYSHKKEYVDWIESAKKPETRLKRIEKAIEVLASRKSPKG